MTDEDREFLEKAMEEAFGKIEDPNKIMQEAIAQIEAEDRTDESIATALEVIDKCCDDVDCARNVEKLNGLQPLIDLLGAKEGSIRVRTCEILALLFSNNPHIQEAGVKRGAMKVLVQLTKECPKASEERAKAFRALVALVRQVQVYEETLVTGAGGMPIILSFLEKDEEAKTREKAMSFARSLTSDGRLQAEHVGALSKALVPLFHDVAEQGIQYREMLAECSFELVRAFPKACADEHEKAARERLAALLKSKQEDSTQEEATYQECVVAFSVGAAESSPAPAA